MCYWFCPEVTNLTLNMFLPNGLLSFTITRMVTGNVTSSLCVGLLLPLLVLAVLVVDPTSICICSLLSLDIMGTPNEIQRRPIVLHVPKEIFNCEVTAAASLVISPLLPFFVAWLS